MNQRITGNPTIAYVAGFVSYLVLLALDQYLPFGPAARFAFRFFLVLGVLIAVSREVIPWLPSRPLTSILLGIAVFFLWVGPDYLFPNYRSHWLFTNSITGSAHSSIDPALKGNTILILFRVLSSVVTVPILEELFWRGWLIRWLIDKDFLKVPIGQYNTFSFWVVALLFASEHGSYWDVGLATGIIYNWWAGRTRNLADCILAHAVTNGCLAFYVIEADQWQYWL
jgi:CAAX prenyl protease-like protein